MPTSSPWPGNTASKSSALRRDSPANEAQAPTAEMAVTPPSIRKSAPTTYAESSDARSNCQLRDFRRIGHPLAWIVGSEDVLNRIALLFAWKAPEHRCVRRTWAQGIHTNPTVHEFGAEDSSEMHNRGLAGRDGRSCRPPLAGADGRIDDY